MRLRATALASMILQVVTCSHPIGLTIWFMSGRLDLVLWGAVRVCQPCCWEHRGCSLANAVHLCHPNSTLIQVILAHSTSTVLEDSRLEATRALMVFSSPTCFRDKTMFTYCPDLYILCIYKFCFAQIIFFPRSTCRYWSEGQCRIWLWCSNMGSPTLSMQHSIYCR